MRYTLAMAALTACSASSAQNPDGFDLECTFTSKHDCGPSACLPAPLTTTVRIDHSGSRYARCSNGTCDTYSAHITSTGVWEYVELAGRPGTFAKISGGQIVEVTTLNLSVLVGYGQCRSRG